MWKELLVPERPKKESYLYVSSDLLGSLRHAQLRIADVPEKEKTVQERIPLETGNLWHDKLQRSLRGEPVMCEVRITDWLPEGWGGRLDYLIWDVVTKKFIIKDLKTVGNVYWTIKKGAKEAHIWQLSSYYHALREAKLPVSDKLHLLYFGLGGKYAPLDIEFEPIPKKEVLDRMKKLWKLTEKWMDIMKIEGWDNKYLQAPLYGHWTSKFCPYDLAYCDCSKEEIDA